MADIQNVHPTDVLKNLVSGVVLLMISLLSHHCFTGRCDPPWSPLDKLNMSVGDSLVRDNIWTFHIRVDPPPSQSIVSKVWTNHALNQSVISCSKQSIIVNPDSLDISHGTQTMFSNGACSASMLICFGGLYTYHYELFYAVNLLTHLFVIIHQ